MSRTMRDPLAMEHALLGLLRRQPMHGYEVYQHLSNPSGLWLVWRIKQSRLYALLARLESEGYLTSTLLPQAGRPPRKMYRLSRSGHDRFRRWVRSPVPHGRDLRLDFLGKFYFAVQEGPATATQLIAKQREACHNWLETMRAEQAARNGESPEFGAFVGGFRIGQIEAMLRWLDDAERNLSAA